MGLEPGEEVLWSGKPSRLGFIGWYVGLFFLILIISALAGVAGGAGAGVFAFFLFSIIFFGIFEKWLQGHKFLVTTQRAIREVDWFGRSVETIDLYNATDVEYNQGWLQKMHNYGNVSILTPGTAGVGTNPGVKFRSIRNPLEVAKKISHVMSDLKK